MVALFSYGTLQLAEVQLATFGRLLEGRADALAGYRLELLTITSPHAVAASGSEVHNIACRAEGASEIIPGVVFEITTAELAAADAYETDAYARVEETLVSGAKAFVYVGLPATR